MEVWFVTVEGEEFKVEAVDVYKAKTTGITQFRWKHRDVPGMSKISVTDFLSRTSARRAVDKRKDRRGTPIVDPVLATPGGRFRNNG